MRHCELSRSMLMCKCDEDIAALGSHPDDDGDDDGAASSSALDSLSELCTEPLQSVEPEVVSWKDHRLKLLAEQMRAGFLEAKKCKGNSESKPTEDDSRPAPKPTTDIGAVAADLKGSVEKKKDTKVGDPPAQELPDHATCLNYARLMITIFSDRNWKRCNLHSTQG